MNLFVTGLSHKTAPVAVREKLAAHPGQLRCNGCRLTLSGGLSELVLVSTCNRVEIYGVSSRSQVDAQALFEQLSGDRFNFEPYIYFKQGREAVEHLFSVAGGLDSMVLGETEITGQVKQAYLSARDWKLTRSVTNRLFQSALQVAKEIRTATGIGRGSTSAGSVAVDLAEQIFGGTLAHKTVMIIGAGKMGEACVRHLAKKGATSLLVMNRSYDKAVSLSSEFGGKALPFEDLLPALTQADIVVTSTGSPQVILNSADVASIMPARRNRALFLIDIAVPRNVDVQVQDLPNVYLYNVDHLEALVRENVQSREKELARCVEIVHAHAEEFLARIQTAAARREAAVAQENSDWMVSAAVPCRS